MFSNIEYKVIELNKRNENLRSRFFNEISDLQRDIKQASASSKALLASKEASSKDADLCESVQFLVPFGLPRKLLKRATQLAIENDTTAAEELITFNGIKEIDYYQLLAKHLNIRFVFENDIESVVLKSETPLSALHPNKYIWGRVGDPMLRVIYAPSPNLVQRLEKITSGATRCDRTVITAPSILRAIITKQFEKELNKLAIDELANTEPLSSAKSGATAIQGAIGMLFFMFIIAFMTKQSDVAALGLHLFMSTFFIACVFLRLLATAQFRERKVVDLESTIPSLMPRYSVMIALHDEAEVVPDLVKAMGALKWPKSKLEIKLVCEADDNSTLLALDNEKLDGRFEVIKVPPSNPRTKPKALCYALGFTTGKYITLYDAEDRPHPEQLVEAYQAFENEGAKLACVQAPLKTANPERSAWAALFHLEYAALFNGLLPWLARRKAPILLGGTSNHFKREALLDVGSWDPYNVTEDADLGMRLWRKGYHTGVINRPTLEDAPSTFKVWLPQRTRWFKGWMQTWIVQMRQPSELQKNMSLSSFLITQILLTGTIASALLHPFIFLKAMYLSYWLLSNIQENIWVTRLAIIDWTTIVCSYIGFIALCWRSTDKKTRQKIRFRTLLLPAYWMAISIAAWRGLYQLIVKPFYWEKTPHTAHEK